MGKGRKSQLLSESLARRTEQEMAMAEQAGSIAVAVQGERTEKQITKQKEKEKKDKAASEPSKLKIGLSDLGATAFAQGFNEGWTYLIQEAGKWSVDGFVAQQNDYLQASVPSIGGLIWYLVELYGLGKAPPSAFKLGRMEAAKLVGNLGMSKFFMALKSRSSEAKAALAKAKKEALQYQADNKAQADQLERMQTQLAELQKQLKQAPSGGGAAGGGGR